MYLPSPLYLAAINRIADTGGVTAGGVPLLSDQDLTAALDAANVPADGRRGREGQRAGPHRRPARAVSVLVLLSPLALLFTGGSPTVHPVPSRSRKVRRRTSH